MTKRSRTLLFFVLLGLFLLTVPAFTLYSQGYRIDFQGWRIAQTGAFYFKVAPPRADVLVDGNLTKKTDFLFGSALTKNFFPGKYFAEIAKEGYHPWQKILEIKERTVIEAKNILLFKKDLAFQKLADRIEHVWISPDSQYALLQKQEPRSLWEMRLLNLDTARTEPLFQQHKTKKDEILDIQWAQDSQRFLVSRILEEQIISEVHSISPDRPCFTTPCDLEYLGKDTGNIRLSSGDSNQILFTKFLNAKQVLFAANYAEKEAAAPIANNVVAFTTSNNNAFWLDQDGALWEKDLFSEASPQIFQESTFLPTKETAYTLIANTDSLFVQESAALFLHKRNSTERREILSPALDVVLSPDGGKAAIRNQTELWVLFLQQEREQPQRQAGELILLTRFSEPIQHLSWIGSSHLVFSLGDTIRAAEIDTRDRLNIVDIAELPESEIFWDDKNSVLYVLFENTLSVSEKIVR